MERVKSLLSHGRHDETATDKLKKGGLNSESSHVEHVNDPVRQPQTTDIVVDSSPERAMAGQEYNTTGTRTDGPTRDEMPARGQVPARKEMPGAYQSQPESRNPYTKHIVDPRVGGGKQQPAAQDEYNKKTSSEYSRDLDTSQSQRYADTSKTADTTASTQQYGRDAAVKGVAAGGAAATGNNMKGDDSRTNAMNQEYSDTTASKTNQNYFAVPPGAEASGPYKTRIASLIDPHANSGGPVEDGYYHTPSGGGGETADKFHRRRSRTISVTNTTGGEASEGVQSNRRVSTQGHAEPQDVSRRSQGTWATAGAKDEEAGMEDYSGRDKETGHGVGVYDYVQKPYEEQHGQPIAETTEPIDSATQPMATTTQCTATSIQPMATTTQPTATTTNPTTTTTQPTVETTKPKTAADYYSSTSVSDAGDSGKQYVEIPEGNQYGRKVEVPQYGVPTSAAGTTQGEAEALRSQNQVETTTGATQPQVETSRAEAIQREAKTMQKQHQDAASKPARKESKRRSSILEFFHLGGRGKKDTKEEEQLPNKERQTYANHDRDRAIGTAATRTSGAGGGVGGGAERHQHLAQPMAQPTQKGSVAADPATLVQRNRQMSTIDAPAFSGGLVDENGNPLDTTTAQKLPEKASTAGLHEGPSTGAVGARGESAATRTAPQQQQAPTTGTAYDSSAPTEPVSAGTYGGSKVTETEDQGLMEGYNMQGGRGAAGSAHGDDVSPHSSMAGAGAGGGSGAVGDAAKVAERGGRHVLHKSPPAGHGEGEYGGEYGGDGLMVGGGKA